MSDSESAGESLLYETADGSLTLFNEDVGEHYHNRAGAYLEALENYVNPSLALDIAAGTGKLRVLDVCFGLGYNTWVLLEELSRKIKTPFTIEVIAVENDPNLFRYMPKVLSNPYFDHLKFHWPALEHNIYYQTQGESFKLQSDVVDSVQMSIDFRMGDLRQIVPNLLVNESEGFDLVFHDAFSPSKVPALWTADLFRCYYGLLSKDQKQQPGRLLTYSAAGAVRGGLQEAGFALYRTLGLGEKLGGTLAVALNNSDTFEFKPVNGQTYPLSKEEQAFIRTRSGISYRDPSFQQSNTAILQARTKEQDDSGRETAGNTRISCR